MKKQYKKRKDAKASFLFKPYAIAAALFSPNELYHSISSGVKLSIIPILR